MNAAIEFFNPPSPSDVLAQSKRIALEVLGPAADQIDQSREFPRGNLEALGAGQVLGLMVPTEFGGAGAGLSEMAAVLETLAAQCASTAMVVLMHYCATAVIAAKSSPRIRSSLLSAIARGEHLSTLAFSEPGSGGHFYYPVSRATQRDGKVELNAFKTFVTSAGHADSYIVSTLSADAVGPQEIDLYFVPAATAGLKAAGSFEGLGLAGNGSAPMNIEKALAPLENRLGEEKSGFSTMLQVVLPHFQIGSAAVSIGIAGGAFQRTIDHVTARKYQHLSNTPLSQIPRVQFLVAEMAMDLRSVRAYLAEAIRKATVGETDAMLDVLGVKAKAAEASVAILNRAMTLGGGTAFGRRGGIERLFRDVQASAVMAPSTDVLKDFVGKATLGLPLF